MFDNVLRRRLWVSMPSASLPSASLPSASCKCISRRRLNLSSRAEVSEGIQEKGVAETELLPLTVDEEDGVDFSLVELGSEAPELKERVYQVLRTRVHIKGDFLHASLDNVHHGVRNTDIASVFFARPLGALTKLPMQIFVLVFGVYFVPSIVEGFKPQYLDETRHFRFSTLETRVPQATIADVGISKLSLLFTSIPRDLQRPGRRSISHLTCNIDEI